MLVFAIVKIEGVDAAVKAHFGNAINGVCISAGVYEAKPCLVTKKSDNNQYKNSNKANVGAFGFWALCLTGLTSGCFSHKGNKVG